MNHGLSEKLQIAFSSAVPVVRPLVEKSAGGKYISESPPFKGGGLGGSSTPPRPPPRGGGGGGEPRWLAGFTDAEGCFLINIYKSHTKLGEAVQLIFKITQHERDEQLIISLIEFLKCGNIYKNR